MFKSVITIGLLLYLIVMGLFLGTYFFFFNENYFNISIIINSFVLPALFIGISLFSIISYKKTKGIVYFRQAFQRIFTPMFIAGFLSLSSIFIFLNYVDTEAKNVLNHQFIERNKQELQNVYQKEKNALKDPKKLKELERDYQIQMQSFNLDMIKEKDMLRLEYFIKYYFPSILIFYLIISLFLSVFFKSKRN